MQPFIIFLLNWQFADLWSSVLRHSLSLQVAKQSSWVPSMLSASLTRTRMQLLSDSYKPLSSLPRLRYNVHDLSYWCYIVCNFILISLLLFSVFWLSIWIFNKFCVYFEFNMDFHCNLMQQLNDICRSVPTPVRSIGRTLCWACSMITDSNLCLPSSMPASSKFPRDSSPTWPAPFTNFSRSTERCLFLHFTFYMSTFLVF